MHNFHYSTILVLEPELLGTVQDVGCSGEFNCKLKRGLVTAWSRKAKVGRVFTKAPTSQELYKQATWDNTVTAPPRPQQIHLNRCSLECWEPHTCSALVNGIFLLQLNGCHISMSSRIVLCFTSKSSGKLPSVEHQTKRILESGQRKKHTHTHTPPFTIPLLLTYYLYDLGLWLFNKSCDFIDTCLSIEGLLSAIQI